MGRARVRTRVRSSRTTAGAGGRGGRERAHRRHGALDGREQPATAALNVHERGEAEAHDLQPPPPAPIAAPALQRALIPSVPAVDLSRYRRLDHERHRRRATAGPCEGVACSSRSLPARARGADRPPSGARPRRAGAMVARATPAPTPRRAPLCRGRRAPTPAAAARAAPPRHRCARRCCCRHHRRRPRGRAARRALRRARRRASGARALPGAPRPAPRASRADLPPPPPPPSGGRRSAPRRRGPPRARARCGACRACAARPEANADADSGLHLELSAIRSLHACADLDWGGGERGGRGHTRRRASGV